MRPTHYLTLILAVILNLPFANAKIHITKDLRKNLTITDDEQNIFVKVSSTVYGDRYIIIDWQKEKTLSLLLTAKSSETLTAVLALDKNEKLVSVSAQEKEQLLKLALDMPEIHDKKSLTKIFTAIASSTNNPESIDSLYPITDSNNWNPICHLKDNWGGAWYQANGKLKFMLAEVGKKESLCLGRCGTQCADDDKPEKYTQECFNHDLCHRIEGTQLGECSEEFMSASKGFLFASTCR